MELFKSLLPVFRIYQCCGFLPFSMPFDVKMGISGQRKWYIHSGLLVCCFIATIIYNLVSFQKYMGGEQSQLLDYLSFIIITMIRIVAVVITTESLLNRTQQIQFLLQFYRISHHLREEFGTDLDYKKIRQNTYFWIGIWLVQMTMLLTLIIVELTAESFSIWETIMWIFCTFPIISSSVRYFQIIHYIQLIGFSLEIVKTQLDDIYSRTNRLHVVKNESEESARSHDAEKIEDGIYDNIVSLRKIYHILWESSVLLNKTFKWSLLSLTAASFIIIVVNYYRTIYYVVSPMEIDLSTLIAFLIWSLGHTFYFIKLSSTCHNVSEYVLQIPNILHSLAFKVFDRDLNHLVREMEYETFFNFIFNIFLILNQHFTKKKKRSIP